MDDAFTVADDDVPRTSTKEDLGDGHARRPGTSGDNPEPLQLLFGEPQRVEQRRQHHDRRAVLIVVEDGNI